MPSNATVVTKLHFGHPHTKFCTELDSATQYFLPPPAAGIGRACKTVGCMRHNIHLDVFLLVSLKCAVVELFDELNTWNCKDCLTEMIAYDLVGLAREFIEEESVGYCKNIQPEQVGFECVVCVGLFRVQLACVQSLVKDLKYHWLSISELNLLFDAR
jgi:hypothetical protein